MKTLFLGEAQRESSNSYPKKFHTFATSRMPQHLGQHSYANEQVLSNHIHTSIPALICCFVWHPYSKIKISHPHETFFTPVHQWRNVSGACGLACFPHFLPFFPRLHQQHRPSPSRTCVLFAYSPTQDDPLLSVGNLCRILISSVPLHQDAAADFKQLLWRIRAYPWLYQNILHKDLRFVCQTAGHHFSSLSCADTDFYSTESPEHIGEHDHYCQLNHHKAALNGNVSYTCCSIFAGPGKYYYICENRDYICFVAPEEAACNLKNCLHCCRSVAELHCG